MVKKDSFDCIYSFSVIIINFYACKMSILKIMKEKYIFISLLFFMAISIQPFFVSPSMADEKGYLAIDPLKTNLVDKELLAAISSHVRNYILGSGKYEIVERDVAVKKGAGLLLGGSLVKLGAKFIVNLRLVDLDTGQVIKDARESSGEEDLLNRLESAVSALIGISAAVSLKSAGDEDVIRAGFGFLYLKSEPPGAAIILDGEDKGITPLTIESLKSGKYAVKLIKNGYFVWKKEIEITNGSVINLKAELETIYGSLVLNSLPSGASIYIDGDLVGVTPLKINNLEGGEYEVGIELKGYERFTDMARVEAGDSHEILALLDETVAHREYRLSSEKRIKKQVWAFGTMALSGIMSVKAYTAYSDSEDAYSKADDVYSSYKNSADPVAIAEYRNLTESYKEEGASKAQDGDNALILSGALAALSIYNFYTMPEKVEYSEISHIVPEVRGSTMFLAWKKRY